MPDLDKCEGWTHSTLLAYMRATTAEMDLRYSQRFLAQERALEKAEAQQEGKNETLNELRGVVTDQQGAFARTAVVNLQVDAITARLTAIEIDQRGMKERGGGLHMGVGYLIAFAGLGIAVLAIYFRGH